MCWRAFSNAPAEKNAVAESPVSAVVAVVAVVALVAVVAAVARSTVMLFGTWASVTEPVKPESAGSRAASTVPAEKNAVAESPACAVPTVSPVAVPVRLVATPADGVPISGVTSVGDAPKLVSDEAVTPAANVVPLSVPAAAVTVIAAVPSKLTPFIARAVCRAVAVPALPVTLVWSPVFVPETVALDGADSVAPSAIVRVAEVAGAVTATLLIDVAVATPSVGVTNTGLVARVKPPAVPLSSDNTVASCAEVVAANWSSPLDCSASPPPGIACNVPSSRINFEPSGVPVARFSIGMTPTIFPAGRFVSVLSSPLIVLFVSVTAAAFMVAKLKLSTLPRPTSPFTIPVGVMIFGDVLNTRRLVPVSLEITPAN